MKPLVAFVLLVSVAIAQEPVPTPSVIPPESKSEKVSVPAGTSVIVEMVGAPSSETIREKDIIPFTVLRDVEVDGKVVIPKGATARAIVVHSRRSGRGHDGDISLKMSDAVAIDGTTIPLRFAKVFKKGTKGETTTYYVIMSPFLFYYSPVWVPFVAVSAPIALLKHGKPKQLPAADRFEVYVEQDRLVQVP